MRKKILLNQGAFTVEVQTQLINDLINIESKQAVINHPLIHETLIISVINVTAFCSLSPNKTMKNSL